MSTNTKYAAKAVGWSLLIILFVMTVIGVWLGDQKHYGNVQPSNTNLCAKGITGQLAQDSGCTPNP